MPSLSSVLRDSEARRALLDHEGDDAALALRRVGLGEHERDVASRPLVMNSLRPVTT